MSDLISRQAAIDAFDKQIWSAIDIPICKEIRIAVKKTIEQLQSAQPEIVRCKDCEYYELTSWAAHECSFLKTAVYGNDFCSWAERRTDE